MKRITAREANQRFAQVLSNVEAGEQVVVTKRGKPVAVISPYRAEPSEERNAVVEAFLRVLNEPLIEAADFRSVSRDEMHERP
ncbi:MAG: type II toxin-antitoxin system prevent-host-death family antitoxin [Alphaproteobacteria bacterium]|nr:type II toxin-antitoxin system prevent-host-death family antitoxin [Alphaproteobacteria bacterium]MBV9153217.1 type II toxin-antitoxin system prevent-host-death family antitoxin [Alphaproteobacteria bacterium]